MGVLLGSLGVKLSTVCVVIEARTPHFLEIQKKQRVIITSKIHFDVVTYPFHLPYYCSTTIVLLLLTFFVHAVQSMISFFSIIELYSYGGNDPPRSPRGVDLAPAFGLFAFLLSFVPEVRIFLREG